MELKERLLELKENKDYLNYDELFIMSLSVHSETKEKMYILWRILEKDGWLMILHEDDLDTFIDKSLQVINSKDIITIRKFANEFNRLDTTSKFNINNLTIRKHSHDRYEIIEQDEWIVWDYGLAEYLWDNKLIEEDSTITPLEVDFEDEPDIEIK